MPQALASVGEEVPSSLVLGPALDSALYILPFPGPSQCLTSTSSVSPGHSRGNPLTHWVKLHKTSHPFPTHQDRIKNNSKISHLKTWVFRSKNTQEWQDPKQTQQVTKELLLRLKKGQVMDKATGVRGRIIPSNQTEKASFKGKQEQTLSIKSALSQNCTRTRTSINEWMTRHWAWWHLPLIPVIKRQVISVNLRPDNLYTTSSRPSRENLLKNKQTKKGLMIWLG